MEKKDVMKQYVTDKYFSKGHWWTKLWQNLVAIITWICVAVPVYWTISSTLLANNPQFIHAWKYEEGKTLFYFFDRFFIIAFILIAIVVVVSTIHNNHRVKQHISKERQYNEDQLDIRKRQLNNFYTQRFGQATFRQHVKHYTVDPEQNLDVNEIHRLYED
ncbi:hypothetical protein LG347_02030 [Lactiplantibacillus plantarum]|uniref:hypothetical protein n=1 Tax=Lactiplantibacillus plantarum TaxID=1590 RepID=UPI0002B3F32E|nr:hypothetical protein [Lactiplantibacillus plantarum]AGE39071.1 putative membrane protein [Lactiplantibacillus plantarum ZJ316]ANI95142.1 hypothetical protein A9F05_05755 [Lactiplantibacillus plantarum]AYG26575.1 hypothetical protein CFI62_00545 [Lactiplantibacillus plantarum]MCB7139184.1 hypothetical protein [Lactiplantibacillus plantarum]MCB7151091.1 hypothetical protein [Lactiplantibacillus plantarum]